MERQRSKENVGKLPVYNYPVPVTDHYPSSQDFNLKYARNKKKLNPENLLNSHEDEETKPSPRLKLHSIKKTGKLHPTPYESPGRTQISGRNYGPKQTYLKPTPEIPQMPQEQEEGQAVMQFPNIRNTVGSYIEFLKDNRKQDLRLKAQKDEDPDRGGGPLHGNERTEDQNYSFQKPGSGLGFEVFPRMANY